MRYDTIPIPGGVIKLKRNEATRELLKDPKAFGLLTTIALRAKRTNAFSVHGLKPGQALIGDHASYGLTEQEYRSAKVRLRRYGLADFKPTHRGTIATLRGETIYDINVTAEQRTNNGQHTDDQRAGHGQATTIKNGKNEKKGKGLPSCSSRSASRDRGNRRTFDEMDRDRAAEALAQAREEFLGDDEA